MIGIHQRKRDLIIKRMGLFEHVGLKKKIQWIIIIVPIQMVIWRVHPADSRSFDVFFVFMIFVNNDYGSLSANTYLPELVVL